MYDPPLFISGTNPDEITAFVSISITFRVAERFDRLIDGRTTAEAIEGRLRDMNGHQDQPQHQQQIPQHQQRNAESKGGRQNGSAADKENRGSSSVYIAAVDKSSSKGGNSKVCVVVSHNLAAVMLVCQQSITMKTCQ